MKSMPCLRGCQVRSALFAFLFTVLIVPLAPAQPVYTQNVVGYVNVVCTNGYQYLSNPLNTTNNSLNSLLPSPPDGTHAWLWNVFNQAFGPPATFTTLEGWDGNFVINPGQGFVLHTSVQFTWTFVGEVMQGALTNFVAGSNQFSLLGSLVPQSGSLSGMLQFPGTDGDNAQMFSVPLQRFKDACNYFAGHGWFDPTGASDFNGPTLDVARSCFIQHPGTNKNWVRNFTVNRPVGGEPPPPEPVSTIENLSIRDGVVTLKVNKLTKRYNVQFSLDQVNWTTVAANQTATVWRGPLPPSPAGFFQIANP